jgi:hypothetical protein
MTDYGCSRVVVQIRGIWGGTLSRDRVVAGPLSMFPPDPRSAQRSAEADIIDPFSMS